MSSPLPSERSPATDRVLLDAAPPDERYSRQSRFAPIGAAGQQRLHDARVALLGCGALGSCAAELLARAGVGMLRLIDRDYVELSNLQRQSLYEERHVSEHWAKAPAAAEQLAKINSSITIESHVVDVDASNILALIANVDLVVDATDNFETRFLLNDAALELGRPWVFGGCVGSYGQTMLMVPGQTACLRCLIESPEAGGMNETCETAGVFGPAVHVVAALQATLAVRWLVQPEQSATNRLTVLDVWQGTHRAMDVSGLRERGDCPACGAGRRDWLQGERSSAATRLCGRNSVQVQPGQRQQLNLQDFAARWRSLGQVTANPFLVRLIPTDEPCEITLFADGRAILRGTEDVSTARGWYARYVGG